MAFLFFMQILYCVLLCNRVTHSFTSRTRNECRYSTTWLFWGFKVFTVTVIFFPVFVSFFFSFFFFFCKPESIQHNPQVWFKDTVFTDLVHTERKTYYRKENSLKVWIFLGEKQSPAVTSKICLGSKTFPRFVVIFTPVLIKTSRLW